jgi:hypothetical protein
MLAARYPMISKRTLCDVLEAMADEKLVTIRALQEPQVRLASASAACTLQDIICCVLMRV